MRARQIAPRWADALAFREHAARLASLRDHPLQVSNGEESEYRRPTGQLSYVANFSKGLPHTNLGEVILAAYRSMVRAISSGNPDHFELIPLGMPAAGLRLTNPQAGLAFDLEGPDAQALTLPPAPRIDGAECAAEMGELYWMALTRDVSFIDYGTGAGTDAAGLTTAAATSLTADFTDFRGPRDAAGNVTPGTLFRGLTRGDLIGPYVSQFLVVGNRDTALGLAPADGFVAYGTIRMDQRQKTAAAGVDYLTAWNRWLAVQRGRDERGTDAFDPQRRFIRNLRDLATYVHFDALYEAYLNACLILLSIPARFDPGNPYVASQTQDGFATFGGPHILSLVTEVATRALKAVWWQKWGVHRRLRPEEFGGRIEVQLNRDPGRYPMIHPEILDTAPGSVLDRILALPAGTALLPMAFPEGCPTHPAYGAGHATVAGACVTILKAWFDESFILENPLQPAADGLSLVPYVPPPGEPPLTVGGELDKVAANVALGRNAAGVHWRSDYTESLKLGEAIALGVLEEQKLCYNEDSSLSVTRFDGTRVVI